MRKHRRTTSILRKVMPGIFGIAKVRSVRISSSRKEKVSFPRLKSYLWLSLLGTALFWALCGYFLEIQFLPSVKREAEQDVLSALRSFRHAIINKATANQDIAKGLAENTTTLNFTVLDHFVRTVEKQAPGVVVSLFKTPSLIIYTSKTERLLERRFSIDKWQKLIQALSNGVALEKNKLHIWGSAPLAVGNDKGILEVSDSLDLFVLNRWSANKAIEVRLIKENKTILSSRGELTSKPFALSIKEPMLLAPVNSGILCEVGIPSFLRWGLARLLLPAGFGKLILWFLLFAFVTGWKQITGAKVLNNNISKTADNEEVKYLRSIYMDFSNSLRKKNIEIQEAKEKVDTILRSVPDGVFTTDGMGKIILWNAGAENITGWSQEEVLDRPYHKILRLCYKENGEYCDVVGEPSPDIQDLYIVTKQGNYLPSQLVASIVAAPDGSMRETVRVLRDMTRQKEIDRFKDDFIAMVTHDLKSPLSSILGYANLLLNPKANVHEEARIKYTNAIIRACKGLAFFLNNLLDSAKLEAGVMTFHMEHFPLKDVLMEVWELFSPIADDKGIKLSFDSPFDCHLFGDREKIKQVLVNLLANAMKFTSQGGNVTLKIKVGDTRIELQLCDNGRGIPEEELPRLFQKFMQVKGEKVGTGLGLFIVRNIVEGHRGEIWVESKIGEGTTFYVSLIRGDKLKSAGFTEETRYRKFS